MTTTNIEEALGVSSAIAGTGLGRLFPMAMQTGITLGQHWAAPKGVTVAPGTASSPTRDL